MLKLDRSPGEVLLILDDRLPSGIRLTMVEKAKDGSVRLGFEGPAEVMDRLAKLPTTTVEPTAMSEPRKILVPAETQSGRPRLGMKRP
ncbi:carbon storage regulator [Pseudomonas aeruginosa]|nr:carbon storage regulator [Pseudomonas aeruginosa]MCS9764298.1 carbon storage regulator [Pseudomonas aeruginosa]MCS9820474.1 carbon storage regulator [Pseudomonas aeruginosa]MCT0241055.1 carbon storage regulator [Pseudomonas aeruginosa]MCT0528508.1 carbon storage regulator [Pseudomonas aeruginosa]